MEQEFSRIFGRAPQAVFSAPGRTELSGNHTDHQHGCVLSAAVNLETTACVARNGMDVIRVASAGYAQNRAALTESAARIAEAERHGEIRRQIQRNRRAC